MVIGTALGWSNLATVVLAIGLAFAFGYTLRRSRSSGRECQSQPWSGQP